MKFFMSGAALSMAVLGRSDMVSAACVLLFLRPQTNGYEIKSVRVVVNAPPVAGYRLC